MSKVGQSILRGAREALAYAKGEPVDVRIHHVMVPATIDVKAIRAKLGMTQEQFAQQFGFPLGTLQNWERGHRRPEGAARAFLTVIDREPDAVRRALVHFTVSGNRTSGHQPAQP